MAERQRFELWIPCGMLAFQASALGHYATSPCSSIARQAYGIRLKKSRFGTERELCSPFRYKCHIYGEIDQSFPSARLANAKRGIVPWKELFMAGAISWEILVPLTVIAVVALQWRDWMTSFRAWRAKRLKSTN